MIVARIGEPLPVYKGGKKVSLKRNHSKKMAKLAEKSRRQVMGKLKPVKPKKPMSNYFIFLTKRRAELVGDPICSKVIQFTSKMGAEWSALSDEEK